MNSSDLNCKRRTGPKPRCSCNDFVGCRSCRSRERSRLAYHGLKLAPLSKLRAAKMRLPDDERVLAYVAGILDGEGCITYTNGRPIVQVGMTDEPVVRWLGEMGGTVRVDKPKDGRKTCYRWRVLAGRDVLALLGYVYPYMRVKRHEAINAICQIWGELLIEAGEAA